MELQDVRELIKLVEQSGIEELEISQKGTTIRIQKSRPGNPAPAATVPAPVPVPDAPAAAPAVAPADTERAKWKEIRSPIVGTFYQAAAPGADPFVRVGDRITEGQTLCIVEAMKVMNEIEAEFSGVIREVLAEDGAPVEAEAVLFLVDPV